MERLNAILMTAFTSALSLAPLVVEGGPGKEILQPLSIMVLGGLFTSTALTLLVLPALYAKFGKILVPKKKVLEPRLAVADLDLNHKGAEYTDEKARS